MIKQPEHNWRASGVERLLSPQRHGQVKGGHEMDAVGSAVTRPLYL
jgi:hypothetical protein